jgi:hypothetical protein
MGRSRTRIKSAGGKGRQRIAPMTGLCLWTPTSMQGHLERTTDRMKDRQLTSSLLLCFFLVSVAGLILLILPDEVRGEGDSGLLLLLLLLLYDCDCAREPLGTGIFDMCLCVQVRS